MLLIETLRGFAAGTHTNEQVVRALIEHDGWLAPAELFATRKPDGQLEATVPGGLTVFSPDRNLPPGRLLVFSALEYTAHAVAQGAHLGAYANGLKGVDLFGAIDTAPYQRLNVNPNAPTNETFFLGADAFGLVKLWASAVALERVLATVRQFLLPSMAEALQRFPAYQALIDASSGNVITLKDQGNRAVVFTAPDCGSAFLAKLPEAARASTKLVTVAGDRLFPFLVDQKVGGAVFNAVGPGPTSQLPLEHCQTVAQVARR